MSVVNLPLSKQSYFSCIRLGLSRRKCSDSADCVYARFAICVEQMHRYAALEKEISSGSPAVENLVLGLLCLQINRDCIFSIIL